MKEYIIQVSDALYNDETGEAVFQPIVVGEVIRCKDCKHWGTVRCGHWDGIWKTEALWFCADGERKEE